MAPGAWRPWFTIKDRELLKLATNFRSIRQQTEYPHIHHPSDGLFNLAYSHRLETNHDKDNQNQPTADIKGSGDLSDELPRHFAILDELISEMRQRTPDRAAVRAVKKLLSEDAGILSRELIEWRERAANLHFGPSRPIRVITGPVPSAQQPPRDTPAAAQPGPTRTAPSTGPAAPENLQLGEADDRWPELKRPTKAPCPTATPDLP